MQEYLQKTQLGAVMDEIGAVLAMAAGCALGFILLWGLRLTALAGALAAFILGMILRAKTRDRRLLRRETRLRQRIGGELVLEGWTVCAPARAHLEAAQLLEAALPLTLLRVMDAGALCAQTDTGERILVACAQLHAAEKLTARDIAALQRACLRVGAARGVICGACGATVEAYEQADVQPAVALIERERMIVLAGAAHPAADRQLVALGRRRRRGHSLRTLRRTVLDAQRAEKYLLYGLMLALLYIFTGVTVYALPALICLLLMALCRVVGERENKWKV